jgi:hypothetical protein
MRCDRNSMGEQSEWTHVHATDRRIMPIRDLHSPDRYLHIDDTILQRHRTSEQRQRNRNLRIRDRPLPQMRDRRSHLHHSRRDIAKLVLSDREHLRFDSRAMHCALHTTMSRAINSGMRSDDRPDKWMWHMHGKRHEMRGEQQDMLKHHKHVRMQQSVQLRTDSMHHHARTRRWRIYWCDDMHTGQRMLGVGNGNSMPIWRMQYRDEPMHVGNRRRRCHNMQ